LGYVFKQQAGMSIRGAVNRVRLRIARHALQETGASLEQIAERSGFQSPYSFSNWFVKQTGLRPGEYRRRWLARKPATRPDKPWLSPCPARPRSPAPLSWVRNVAATSGAATGAAGLALMFSTLPRGGGPCARSWSMSLAVAGHSYDDARAWLPAWRQRSRARNPQQVQENEATFAL
jgi:hypothetical protein